MPGALGTYSNICKVIAYGKRPDISTGSNRVSQIEFAVMVILEPSGA